jgi:type IV secretory pathway component VirB8
MISFILLIMVILATALLIALKTSEKFLYWFDDKIEPIREFFNHGDE